MTLTHPLDLGSCVIQNGGTTSSEVNVEGKRLSGIIIYAPAALTDTCHVKVSGDHGATYQFLQSGGSNIEVGAGDAVAISFCAFHRIIILSGGAEGAERTFVVKGVLDR
jgi:hypothetical protein